MFWSLSCTHLLSTLSLIIIHRYLMKPVQRLKGVCSIGILMYVILVNVCSCRGTRIGFETARGLPCVAFVGYFMWLSLAQSRGVYTLIDRGQKRKHLGK